MQIGYIGLGKMGLNMVQRMLEKKHEVVVYNRSPEPLEQAKKAGAITTHSFEELVKNCKAPRLIWIMVSHQAVDEMIQHLLPFMEPGDTIIDGGNSPYKDSIRRAKELDQKQINFMDVGTSGGPAGARNGACLMIGGRQETFNRYEPLFKDLAVENGYALMGEAGAGHFVKMVHNGIEYGMMQALAEGFAVMKASPFKLDLSKIAEVYNHKSVVESRLVGWLKSGYDKYGKELESISPTVAHSGEGQWTIDAAKEYGIEVPIIEGSLEFRKQSTENPSYTGKILSTLRNQFGGHQA